MYVCMYSLCTVSYMYMYVHDHWSVIECATNALQLLEKQIHVVLDLGT